MYGHCLKCKDEDVSSLMNWDTLYECITCPSCGHKMTVHYEESWEEGWEDEISIWWLEDFKE